MSNLLSSGTVPGGVRKAYALDDALFLYGPRDRLLPIRMHQLRQRGGAHKHRHLHILAEDVTPRVPHADIPQHPRPEPYAIEEGLIGLVRDQIGRGAGVKCPRLGRQGLFGHGFKVVRGDEG